MISTIDQMGNIINLHQIPLRIVSLVPSQTELLHELGLENEVIGITKFCVHPNHWHKNKTRIGGTKTLNISKIKALKPDLVIANKEENVQEQIEAVQRFAPVYVSDINNLHDALEMMQKLGILTGKTEETNSLILKIKNAFQQINPQFETQISVDPVNKIYDSTAGLFQNKTSIVPPVKVTYLIWRNPYMTVGGDTFIGDMIRHSGMQNVFENYTRYPSVTLEDIRHSGCNVLLLSSEPFPFRQKHINEFQLALPGVKIVLVDGEMFSWYGSRLLPAATYLMELKKQIETLSSSPTWL